MILGTAAYMSARAGERQAGGQRADSGRSASCSGLLTGQRLFEGETVSHTLADVLRAASTSTLPADTPEAIRDLLRRCLDRDVKGRLRDIGEARIAIEESLSGLAEDSLAVSASVPAVAPVPQKRTILPAVAAAPLALGTALAVALGIRCGRRAEPRNARRSPADAPGRESRRRCHSWSERQHRDLPDGTCIVFPIRDTDGKPLLALLGFWIRRQSQSYPDRERYPRVLLPDGQSIGFVANENWRRSRCGRSSGCPLRRHPVPRRQLGEERRHRGNFFRTLGGLQSIPSAGGAPHAVTKLARRSWCTSDRRRSGRSRRAVHGIAIDRFLPGREHSGGVARDRGRKARRGQDAPERIRRTVRCHQRIDRPSGVSP